MNNKEYTWCFACGKDNPIGLKMEFDFKDDRSEERRVGKEC